MEKKFSKFDKSIVGLVGILALDSIVIPFFSGGRTLHDLVGLSPSEASEFWVKAGEGMSAGLGVIYLAGKNFYNAWTIGDYVKEE